MDCGGAAADALAALVRRRVRGLRGAVGRTPMGRPLAVCRASGTELNHAVVAAGWARGDRSLPGLDGQEAEARSNHRGLWATGESW